MQVPGTAEQLQKRTGPFIPGKTISPAESRRFGRTPQRRTPPTAKQRLTDACLSSGCALLTSIWRVAAAVLDLLGNVDGHHTVFDLGRNILALDIVGQQQALLELRVGEFAAQVGAFALASSSLFSVFFSSEITSSLSSLMWTLKSPWSYRSGDLDLVFVSPSMMLTAGAMLRRSASQLSPRISLKIPGSQF